MKISSVAETTARTTLQSVLDRIAGDRDLAPSRKRDLRSAVATFVKLAEKPAVEILLDVGAIRKALDAMVRPRRRYRPRGG